MAIAVVRQWPHRSAGSRPGYGRHQSTRVRQRPRGEQLMFATKGHKAMNNETPSAFTTGRITWISHPGQDTARTRFTLAEIDAAGIERNEHGFECATELLPLTNTTRERGRPLLREFHGCTVAVEHCGAVVRSVVYA